MDIEQEILQLKADIRLLEHKLNALIDVLGKEGVVAQDDINDKLEECLLPPKGGKSE
jgi:hypothetical protein